LRRASGTGNVLENWSADLKDEFAGAPPCLGETPHKGEFVLTASGIEGSLVYALSAPISERIAQQGAANVPLDLLPDRS